MSGVVYVRVPDALKRALQGRARELDRSQTSVVVELLERGLEAVAAESQASGLERRLAVSAGELEQLRARLEQAEVVLQAAGEREQLIARTFSAFAERAGHELASCPQCKRPLRGSDLFVGGYCPNCEEALTSWLVPSRFGSLVQHEYSALLGSLGVLAGLATATAAAGDARSSGRRKSQAGKRAPAG